MFFFNIDSTSTTRLQIGFYIPCILLTLDHPMVAEIGHANCDILMDGGPCISKSPANIYQKHVKLKVVIKWSDIHPVT